MYLGHLRSYEGMGAARMECRSGCTCAPSRADGLWSAHVSLMQMHTFKARGGMFGCLPRGQRPRQGRCLVAGGAACGHAGR